MLHAGRETLRRGCRRERAGFYAAVSARVAAALLCAYPCGASSPAQAGFTPKDGQVLGRTMGYVGEGRTGATVIAVVFLPDHSPSRREAELVRDVIGDGLTAGRIRLQARLVPLGQLAELSGVDALYVTPGTANDPAVPLAARRLRVPTVSTSMECVEAAHCAVSFSTEPTVQIVINRNAAERAGVQFTQAFRLLVTER
ncbi:hypothetical protein [Roseomonas sp. BN140053]|uniref:hypothetical protein n=1 Tax=Roseomonas sp. BN140053 TaxID=3391898 RepID=UPI0039E75DEE